MEQNGKQTEFKVVGYYPAWEPEETGKIDFGILTHIVYAFAIPTADGGLLPLKNRSLAEKLIAKAHQMKRKVLIAVGGWGYEDISLEAMFAAATVNHDKREKLSDALVNLCLEYGFDGVDVDWEHPRVKAETENAEVSNAKIGNTVKAETENVEVLNSEIENIGVSQTNSGAQYEAFMLLLADKLHGRGKVLTSAVISGATADGGIYEDAAAHSDAVLNAVDWIHVMAYDGGDADSHSTYRFAVDCAKYWKDTRGVLAEKVVLGVPFYGRPGWTTYEKLLKLNKDADKSDTLDVNGITCWYNGVDTITAKAEYAKDNLGGIMIWELTQDTCDEKRSLLKAIGRAVQCLY